ECRAHMVDVVAKVERGPPEPLSERHCREAPAARTNHRRVGWQSFAREKSMCRLFDSTKLAVCEIAGERHPIHKITLAFVTPKHAAEPRRALTCALSALVRRGIG